MKKYFFLILLFGAFLSCEKNYIKDDSSDNSTAIDSTANSAEVDDDSSNYTWDSSQEIVITLNGNSITSNSANVTVSGSVATITADGVYRITGSLTDGQIIVNTADEGKVMLLLNGVNITSATNAPVNIEKAKKVVVYLESNTENVLTDGTTYVYPGTDVDEPNAALFSKADLTIFGGGLLNIKANYKDAISSKDGLIITSGNITLTAADDGIRGKDYLVINDGNISATTGGDGLKSDNEDNTALGFITIKSGKITVVSGGDAIAALTNVNISNGELNLTSGGGSSKTVASTLSAKGIKGDVSVNINGGVINVNAADDAIHSNAAITINKGTLTLSSADDGMHAETQIIINDGDVTIAKSVEGIESGTITINNGTVSITASDDGFNASHGNGGESNDGSLLSINSGYVYVNASGGDALDSNGSIVITGGTIVAHGPQSSPEVGMDYNGTCNISGGFLGISGTNSNMTQAPSTTSTQYCVKIMMTSALSANTIFHIQDASGIDVVTFKPARNYYSIVLSSPNLIKGSTYTIYTGGSSTGTLLNGLYTGGAYTPGTQYGTFTVSSIITTIGSSSGPGR